MGVSLNPDCLFCKIVKGDIPAKFIYEDDAVVAFADIAPVAPIHYLIIPKQHFLSVLEMPVELISRIHVVVQSLAKDNNIYENGFRLITNVGRDGGQVVPHAHWHFLAGQLQPDSSSKQRSKK